MQSYSLKQPDTTDKHYKVRKQYDDYDGIWLGHIAQFIFLFFFLIGLVDNVAIIIGTKTDGFPSSPNNDICLYMAQANAAKKLSNLLTS